MGVRTSISAKGMGCTARAAQVVENIFIILETFHHQRYLFSPQSREFPSLMSLLPYLKDYSNPVSPSLNLKN